MAWECLCGVSNRDSKNTCSACGTPKGMVWTPAGFRTPDEADTVAQSSPGPASTKAVKIAWIRVVKAEDGGLDGEGVWAPAMTGYTPGNESDFERMYLEGSLVQIERS